LISLRAKNEGMAPDVSRESAKGLTAYSSESLDKEAIGRSQLV
jgi:hypothetical protein